MVQKYIHLFGDDPTKVTILGKSAGASSVEAHITAYGGSRSSSPFRGAIAQSPYYLLIKPLPNSKADAVLKYEKSLRWTAFETCRRQTCRDLIRFS